MSNEQAYQGHFNASTERPVVALGGSYPRLFDSGMPRRWSSRGLLPFALAASLVLGACQTAPVPPPQVAPAVVSLQEYMQQGAKAAADGSRQTARETYRAAAKAFPASKEPWVKLSEDYFEAADYGNAILAAQEVLLRDANDNVATSIVAVSGLRLSVPALQSLRAQDYIVGSTRSEAESMTRSLREVLGETVLVPRSVPPPKARTKPRANSAAPAPAAVPASAAAPGPAPSAGNPFDKLK